jgi:hypothetical protein
MKIQKKLFQKALFPFIGIGAFLWLLIRVLPKPSRASYPCMRVAAPLASTFIIWLFGLGTSVLFFKRTRAFLRQSKYFSAIACLVAGAISGGIFFSMPHSATFAEIKANAPLGEAKGANPGRVVWIHDSTVSNWKGLGDGHWWEDSHTSQTIVDRMLSHSLRSLSGKSDDSSAWDTLFRYFNQAHGRGGAGYKPGEKIAVKINLTFCNFYPAFCCVDSMTYGLNKKLDYMNTSPQAVRGLLRQLVYVVGMKQSDISIGDPVAYYAKEFYDSCHKEFPDVHYIDHAGRLGRTKAVFSDIPMNWSCRPANVKQDYVPLHYAEATYLINLANMKSHLGAGITLCAKNHYGSFIRLPIDTNLGYYNLHQSLAFITPAAASYRAQVDIMGHAHLGGKTLLYLIDGLYEGNHNNDTVPHTWNVSPFNGGWTSSLFASQDPVAIESVLFDLFQFDQDTYKYHTIAGAQDYLVEAAQAGNPPSGTFYDPDHASNTQRLRSLGVFEHWNNPVDRKYSRNLSTGSGIELVFIDEAANHIRSVSPILSNGTAYSLRTLQRSALVELSIPKSGLVKLTLFDCCGRLAGSILNEYLAAGTYQVNMFPGAKRDKARSSGFYFINLLCKETGSSRPVYISSKMVSMRSL